MLDRSRDASTMRHVARRDRKKKSQTKTRSDNDDYGYENYYHGVVYGIKYFVHCRVPYRRHTRICVETRRQYQNIVRVVGAGVGGGSSSYYFKSHEYDLYTHNDKN